MMTNEEAINWLQLEIDLMKFNPSTGEETYLIPDDYARNVMYAIEMAIEALKVQKVGHWIADREDLCITHICSNCNKKFEDIGEAQKANYCPICGTRIEVESER